MITLREMHYLVAVAEERHFGRAAARCAVSQPALSGALKKVEGRLGITLFERSSRSIELTAHGRALIDQARRVLDESARFDEIVRGLGAPLAGTLTLGVIPTLSPYLLPLCLERLQRDFPDLRLAVREALTETVLAGVATHRYDAMLLALPDQPPQGLNVAPLFDEPFVFLCREDSPLAARDRIALAEVAEQPLLLLEDGHCLRDQALEVCAAVSGRAQPRTDFSAASIETLRQMVALGLGATLLPALAVRPPNPLPAGVRAIPIADSVAARRISLVWRRRHPWADHLPQVAQAIRESVGPHLPAHAGAGVALAAGPEHVKPPAAAAR